MVCQFLLYNKVNQLYIYIYPHVSSLLHLPPTLPTPSLQVVTKHRVDLPVLCGCFLLASYFTFGSVYMSMPLSHFIPVYPFPSPCPQVHSLHLCLYSCPAPTHPPPHVLKSILYICIFIPVLPLGSSEPFFLDSIYMCQHTVFVFLFLTDFTLYDRLQVHPPH